MILGIGAGVGFGQTVTGAEKWALSFDGVDDYLRAPNMTFDKVILEMEVDHKVGTQVMYVDGRNGHVAGFLRRNTSDVENWGTGISSVKMNNLSRSNNTAFIPGNQKVNLEVAFAGAFEDNVDFFRSYDGTSATKGKIYSVEIYNGTNLIAKYDIFKGDQLKNGMVKDEIGTNHATIGGATWVKN